MGFIKEIYPVRVLVWSYIRDYFPIMSLKDMTCAYPNIYIFCKYNRTPGQRPPDTAGAGATDNMRSFTN